MNRSTVPNKLPSHVNDPDGVQSFAFSPNNQLIASGGTESLCIWSLKDGGQLMRHFQKPKTGLNIPSIRPEVATGGIETNYNNQNRLAEASIAQVSWSHDGLLLAAAIHNMVAIFDIRKLE